ncbi:MAG: F0F1 ATP synthase subunit B family protein [Alphaproteobacteria bacterium]
MSELIKNAEFWVAVSFLIFVAFVLWKGLKPMLGALDARAAKIKQELDDAQGLREEAQKLLAEYQRKERDAASEAEAMLAHAREEAGRLRAKAAEDLKASIARREAQALDRIAQAEAQAEADVRAEAVNLAIAATRHLLADKLDAKEAGKLVDNSIKELPGKLH